MLAGPERIESGWWDGADVQRDYYVASDPRGARLWIYRRMRGRRTMVPARNLRMKRIEDSPIPEYAELHCLSNFSFLRGASHAEELVVQAKELGYAALAITDECSLAGVVRAHSAVKKVGGIKLLIGAEFTLACGLRFVVIARNRAGYGRLSRLITRGRRAAEKGSYALTRADVEEFVGDAAVPREHEAVREGTLALWLPPLSDEPGRIQPGRASGWPALSPAAPGSPWSSRATAAIANGWRIAASSARRSTCR